MPIFLITTHIPFLKSIDHLQLNNVLYERPNDTYIQYLSKIVFFNVTYMYIPRVKLINTTVKSTRPHHNWTAIRHSSAYCVNYFTR